MPGDRFEPPAFRARAPWWGGDLQTVRNRLVDPGRPLPGERLLLPTRDGSGDRLQALLNRPPADDGGRPLMVLIHGLGGCESSAYMLHAAAHWLARGHSVLRLNQRGAGPSRATCGLHFHAGRSDDIADALAGLPADLLRDGIFLVGFSVGGNCLLKFAAETDGRLPVRGLAAVSAPIDLEATARFMQRRRAAPYQRFLLRGFVRECLGPGARLAPEQRTVLCSARSFFDLDDRFTAPRNGFRDAVDYYRRARALGRLDEIRLPTLVIQAKDDPVVPAAACFAYDWRRNRCLRPLLVAGGGHVGFHAREGYWHLAAIDRFFGARAAA